MRTLLALLLAAPAVALAQGVPSSPPPPPLPRLAPPHRTPSVEAGAPDGPPGRARRPLLAVPGNPAPTASPPIQVAPPPGRAGGGAPPPAAEPPGAISFVPVAAEAHCTPIQGRFLLSFNKADIVDVLEQASRWTCRNFIYTDEVAKGKITLLSKAAVTADEAYAAFLSALASNGISIFQTGKYWKLVRAADAKKAPIPTVREGEPVPDLEQPVTKLLRLTWADADQVRGVLGNFLSPQGADVQAIPPSLLIVTDTGLNVRRMEEILAAIDRPGASESVRLLQIRYAPVKDVADKVNQVFAQAPAAAKGVRRPLLSPTPPARPGPGAFGAPRPAQPAPAESDGDGGAAIEVQVSKVIPDERTNKLIVIADDRSYERILELVKQLDVPTAEEGGIQVVFLHNATAEDLATTLQNLAQGKSGATKPGGGNVPNVPGQPPAPAPAQAAAGATTAELFRGEVKVTADKAQNALVIQAGAADIVTIRRLIEKLDRARRQVFIEAAIMEVTINHETDFGVGGHTAVPITTSAGTAIIPVALAPGRISTLGAFDNIQSLTSLGGFLTGYAGPTSTTIQAATGLSIPSLGVLVQALQTDSDVNVLSTPHILAADNEESEIIVGQNVPFQAGYTPPGLSGLLGGGLGTTAGAGLAGGALGVGALGMGGLGGLIAPIQREPVELKLKIKPQISEGDNVKLKIEEQNEEIVSTDPVLGPTTAKRSVKTVIVARDQSTIVIGGLIQERNTRTVKKVPFLGDMPLVGWLFRDTINIKQKTNLLLFLTPYIIRDEADYRRIYEKKRAEQQEFMEQFYGRRSGYEIQIDFSRKTGPYTRLRRDVQEEGARFENGGAGGAGERLVQPPGTGEPPATPPPPPSLPPPSLPPPSLPPPGAASGAPPPGAAGATAASPVAAARPAL